MLYGAGVHGYSCALACACILHVKTYQLTDLGTFMEANRHCGISGGVGGAQSSPQ